MDKFWFTRERVTHEVNGEFFAYNIVMQLLSKSDSVMLIRNRLGIIFVRKAEGTFIHRVVYNERSTEAAPPNIARLMNEPYIDVEALVEASSDIISECESRYMELRPITRVKNANK